MGQRGPGAIGAGVGSFLLLYGLYDIFGSENEEMAAAEEAKVASVATACDTGNITAGNITETWGAGARAGESPEGAADKGARGASGARDRDLEALSEMTALSCPEIGAAGLGWPGGMDSSVLGRCRGGRLLHGLTTFPAGSGADCSSPGRGGGLALPIGRRWG